MTPEECYEHYEETGNRQFEAFYHKQLIAGEITLENGYSMSFRSKDCEELGIDVDKLDWSPW